MKKKLDRCKDCDHILRTCPFGGPRHCWKVGCICTPCVKAASAPAHSRGIA